MKKLLLILSIFCSSFIVNFSINNNETILLDNEEVNNDLDIDLYSSGAVGGYKVNKPFDISVRQTSYLSSTGYLYISGYNSSGHYGIGHANNITSYQRLYKDGNETDYFRYVKDWSFSFYGGTIIDENGKIWTAGEAIDGVLGNGTTSGKQYSFKQINEIDGDEDYVATYTASSWYHTIVLLDNGKLYAAGNGKYFGYSAANKSVFTEVPLPYSISEDEPQIKDFAGGITGTWILYDNGELYKLTTTTTKVLDNIDFFDTDGSCTYLAAVDFDNNVIVGAESSIKPESYTVRDVEKDSDVVQVRTAGLSSTSSWGYLTKEGSLYTAVEQSADNAEMIKQEETDIKFFDMGSSQAAGMTVYGYLNKHSLLYTWGSNASGQLANGSTGSSLSDPNHSESSLIAPSLEADFTGLYSLPPILRRSYNDVALGANEEVLWNEEGFIYVDYSNYDFNPSKQERIDVIISDKYGVVDLFSLDKSMSSNKNANYTKKPGTYTVTSMLYEYVDAEWIEVGSANTTVFELGVHQVDMFVDDEIVAQQMNLIKSYDSRDFVPDIIQGLVNSFDLGAIRFSDNLYEHDGSLKIHNVTTNDFTFKFYRETISSGTKTYYSTLKTLSTSSLYRYGVEIKFLGIEDFYDSIEYNQIITIETRSIYSSSNARFGYYNTSGTVTNTTSINYYNSNVMYDIVLNSVTSLTNYENLDYRFRIVITSTTNDFTSEFWYDKEMSGVTWEYIPKYAGTYTVHVYQYEYYDYGIISYPLSSSRTLTISKVSPSAKINEFDTEAIEEIISTVGVPSGGDVIPSIERTISSYLNDLISLDQTLYVVNSNNLFEEMILNSSNIGFAYYIGNTKVNTITEGGTYDIRLYFCGDNNYNTSSYTSSSYYEKITITLEDVQAFADNCVTFDNETTEVLFYSGTEYGLIINGYEGAFDTADYSVLITITDNFGFNSSYDIKTVNTWDYMPKLPGEYTVVISLTDLLLNATSYSYSTLTVKKDESVSLSISEGFSDLFTTFLTEDDENIIDNIYNPITVDYFSISSDLYSIQRVNGKDVVNNVVTTTLSDYNILIYNSSNEVVESITSAGNYYLMVSYKGINGLYENITNNVKYNFEVILRTTLQNVEVGNKFGATAYFVNEDGQYRTTLSYLNNSNEYSIVIDAVMDDETFFTNDIYTITLNITNGIDTYNFEYVNPIDGTIPFKDMPKKSGVYTVEMVLTNNFDEYVSIQKSSLTITNTNLVITISEETQFSTDERKEVLNDEVEEYLITTLSVSMFGVN
ncbi:MAG: hypothetical protein R3Y60_05375, partial [bacterium]